jgi:hypothetical protein
MTMLILKTPGYAFDQSWEEAKLFLQTNGYLGQQVIAHPVAYLKLGIIFFIDTLLVWAFVDFVRNTIRSRKHQEKDYMSPAWDRAKRSTDDVVG